MRFIRISMIALTIALFSCSKEESEEYNCEKGDPNIIGARCNDGERSNATGQGACSHHGGVKHWICQD